MDKEKLQTALKWGLGLGVVGVGGVVALFLLKSLVAIAALGLVGLLLVNFTPVIAQRIAVLKLKAVKHDASVNPIETLELSYQQRAEKLTNHLNAIKRLSTVARNYGSKMEEFKQKMPNKAADFEKRYQYYQFIIQEQTHKAQAAQTDLAEFAKVIQEGQMLWEMRKAEEEANKEFGAFEQPDFMQTIREQTAFDAIQNSLNQSMAELELSMAMNADKIPKENIPAVKELPMDAAETLEVPSLTIKEKVGGK